MTTHTTPDDQPLTPTPDDRPILLWEIDDGATHWVAARSQEEALQLHASNLCGTMEVYLDECCDGEMPTVNIYLKDKLHVRTDDGADALKGYPSGAFLQIVIPRSSYKDLPIGLVATTEY